ncbi:MAG TPA: YcaO-like family protein [Polyangiales bacterium]|nr:YcaO-like family protein [Polyangiales bacterium]
MDQASLPAYRHGTHRTVAPEETLGRLAPLLPEFEITRVGEVTGLDCIGIPTVMVVRPNARSHNLSFGKGGDLLAAKASGVMEAIEHYHAERPPCPLRLGSASELLIDQRVLAPDRLTGRTADCSANERLLWAEGRGLTGNRIWAPLEQVHLDLRLPLPAGSGFFRRSTAGLASGNTLAEAVVHGVCELIERDALSLFMQRSPKEQQRRRVDLQSVDDPLCIELLWKYADANVQVAAWDLTSDVRIPCFLVGTLDERSALQRPLGLGFGSGCHVSRAVALARALCDAAQQRVRRLVGASKGEVRELASRLAPLRAAFAESGPTPTTFLDLPIYEGQTLDDDIGMLQQKLEVVDVTATVVDLSRSQYPVHVVRVVATDLESDASLPGYEPGPRASRVRAERGAA